MKKVKVNGVSVEVFQENDIIEKLGRTKDDWKLVKDYQKKFWQLLQDDEGFCVDGEVLCKELEIKDNFNTWLLGETRYDKNGKIKWQGKLIAYRFKENKDYISDWGIPNAQFSKEDVEKMSPQQRSAHGIKIL